MYNQFLLSIIKLNIYVQVFPKKNVCTALSTIYNFNVLKFKGGTMGAVNGMRPTGEIDLFTIQSEEVWVGTVYSLAALMLHEVSSSKN
jgi:non-lysosomal glucosylceramidase